MKKKLQNVAICKCSKKDILQFDSILQFCSGNFFQYTKFWNEHAILLNIICLMFLKSTTQKLPAHSAHLFSIPTNVKVLLWKSTTQKIPAHLMSVSTDDKVLLWNNTTQKLPEHSAHLFFVPTTVKVLLWKKYYTEAISAFSAFIFRTNRCLGL